MKAALGVDLGGTHVRAGLVSADGERLKHVKGEVSDRSPRGVVEAIAKTVKQVLAQADGAEVQSVGVGIAGMLKGDTVAVAPNLGWRDVPLGSLLHEKLKQPVKLMNDLNVAAWGEFKAGVARGQTDTFTVFVGSGVGSAIITAGKLMTGTSGVAGEFGHVKVAPGGRLCGCGMRGCLEAYAGGHKLSEWMVEVGLKGTPADLELAATRGVPDAMVLYDFAASSLALAIANQVTVLNPGCVVLGGGVLNTCPGMVQHIREAVGQQSARVAGEAVKVEMAQLGDDSGWVGAALLAAES